MVPARGSGKQDRPRIRVRSGGLTSDGRDHRFALYPVEKERPTTRIFKRLPSPAMIVAVVALVAGLSGTAIAGGKFLTKKQGLTKKQFNNQAIRGPIQYVSTPTSVPVTGSSGATVTATCPPGTHVIGGRIRVSLDDLDFVNDSHPTSTGWAGTVFNTGSVAHTFTTTAICAVGGATGSLPIGT